MRPEYIYRKLSTGCVGGVQPRKLSFGGLGLDSGLGGLDWGGKGWVIPPSSNGYNKGLL